MKAPAPELQNTRIVRLANQFIRLPLTAVVALWTRICRLTQWCKSSSHQREEDQLRQSRARRTLRGLPPDHDQRTHKPS